MSSVIPVTIPAGGSLSNEVFLGSKRVIGIQMPAANWTTATLTFQGANDSANTMTDLYVEAGTEFSITSAVAASIVTFSQDNQSRFDSVRRVSVRSGTTGSPVNQAGPGNGVGTVINLIVHDPSEF